ncbi:MAG: NADH-quinone oxidoreductase subunit H [Elusimicrobia bacterium]|nr:NADH-quinone oxidoreductase subunit H [Elusimicrobiota bacterium]
MTETLWSLLLVSGAVGLGLNISGLLGWVERKQSAVLQDRIGANRADILGVRALGLFHPIADALKAIAKEDFAPPFALQPWHRLAPVLSLAFSMVTLAALPYGDVIEFGGRAWSLQPLPMPAGIVFVLGMLAIGVHGVVMAGYASGSNYALLGGLRGAAQMISYEVSLLTSLVAVLFIYGTLDLAQAVRWQAAHGVWGIFLQPLGFILFLTAGAAETKRAPFDVPEGESEIVGYFIEYSGMKFVMFLMTDFMETIVLAGLCTALFLGGWQLPGLGLVPQPWLGLAQVAVFLGKMCAIIFLLMQIRWTLPRFRFDQLLALGWKSLLPLSLLNALVTMWLVFWLS